MSATTTTFLLCTIILAAALADFNADYKRSAFGTMRFGKRSNGVYEMQGDSLPRLARSGASLGTMRFGKRAMSHEIEPEDMEYYSGVKRAAALGTMRFGRR